MYISICTYVFLDIKISTHTYDAYVCMYIYMYTHIYIYIYIHIHIYIYIYIYIGPSVLTGLQSFCSKGITVYSFHVFC